MCGALPVLCLEGDAYTRGLQHGQALREAIRGRCERVLQAWASAGAGRNDLPLLPTARALLPPEVWQEVRGIAEGAEVPLEAVLLLNLWRPDGPAADGFLLAFGEAESGSPYLGWVGEGPCQDAVLLVHRTLEGDAYAVLGQAGEAGGVLGVNSAGLAGTVREVLVQDRRTWGTPAKMLLALGLARATTVDGAAGEVARVRRAGGGAILWTEGTGNRLALEEFTAHRHALEAPQKALLWQGFRDLWLQELAPTLPQRARAEEQAQWLEANLGWIGPEKAWDRLVEELQDQGDMAALLDVASARLWVAFRDGEEGLVGLGPVPLEEFLAGRTVQH